MKQYVALAGLLFFSMPSVANDAEKIELVRMINAPLLNSDKIPENDKGVFGYADDDLKRWIRLGNDKGSNCYDDVCYCYNDPDIRSDSQDLGDVRFTYSISPKGYVNVESIELNSDRGTYRQMRNLQYKVTGSPGNYKVSDIFIQDENGSWSSWKQGFKDCYAGRK